LRFDQPDPSDGSYDLSDPQSFNRYAYVGGDPVNFIDPSSLERQVCQLYHGEIVCESDNSLFPNAPGADQGYGAFGGWGGGWDFNSRPAAGRSVIESRENASDPFYLGWYDPWERILRVPFPSMFSQEEIFHPGRMGQERYEQRERERRQKIYDQCWKEAVEELIKEYHPKLEKIMRRNLTHVVLWGIAGSGLGSVNPRYTGIAISSSILDPLYNWYNDVQDFESNELGPAREAAKQRCREEAGR
jgi:hypothetical protein